MVLLVANGTNLFIVFTAKYDKIRSMNGENEVQIADRDTYRSCQRVDQPPSNIQFEPMNSSVCQA